MTKWGTVIVVSSFMIFNHPLSLVVVILMSTVFMSMNQFSSNINPWTNYILILTFLGGMMIIFMYVASLTPNNNFLSKYKMFMLIMPMSWPILLKSESQNTMELINLIYSSSITIISFMIMLIIVILIMIMNLIYEPYNPMKNKS